MTLPGEFLALASVLALVLLYVETVVLTRLVRRLADAPPVMVPVSPSAPPLTGEQLCALDRHDWQCIARLTQQTPAFETPNVEVSSWRCFRVDCTAKREETWHHGVPS